MTLLSKYGFVRFTTAILMWSMVSSFMLNNPLLIHFTVLPESKMNVSGRTNVKDFIFYSNHAFGNNQTGVSFNAAHTQVQFEDAVISMDIASMDGGMKAMNADMAHALKADQFPYITIRVLSAEATSGETLDLNNGMYLTVNVQISMAGLTRVDVLQCFAKQLDEKTFQFIGEHSLQLTNYGVEPPTALLGLVKVQDSIKVKFDLMISTSSGAD